MDDLSINQNEGSGQVIHCGISRAFHNKTNKTGRQAAFGDSFKPTAQTPEQLAAHILQGGAFTPGCFKTNRRTKENFTSSQLLGLDFDNGVSVAQAAADPFIQRYAFLIYPTPSSTPEHPKTRVLFVLSEPVCQGERWEAMQRGLIARFSHWKPDPACKDSARLFFGSDRPGSITLKNTLPLTSGYELTYDEALDDYLRFIQPPPERDYSDQSPDDLRAQVTAALSFIPARDIDYATWVSVLAALYHTFGLDAESMAESWSGWCSKPGEIGEKIASFTRDNGKKAGVGTIFHLARQHGYILPARRYDESGSRPARAPTDSPSEWTSPPDSWRSAMLDYFPASTALLMELLFRAIGAGLIDPQDFTALDLQAANVGLAFNAPKTTLRRALEERTTELFPFFQTIVAVQDSIVGNFGINSTRGRKATRYRLRPYAEVKTAIEAYANPRIYERAHETSDGAILAHPTADMVRVAGVGEGEAATVACDLDTALTPAYQAQGNQEQAALKRAKRRRAKLTHDLDNHHSTPLPEGWPLGSPANYRATFIHATVKADPETRTSRRQLADRAGVDPRYVTALRKRAGIQVDPQPETRIPVQSFNDVRAYGKQHRAFAYCLVAKKADGHTEKPADNESFPAFIARQRGTGAEVVAHFQHTNKLKIVSEVPPAPAERKPREHVEGLKSRPVEHTSEPKPERYYGPGYDPRWVLAQLQLALKLLGWQWADGRLVDPQTGEIAPDEPRDIIELLIGRALSPPEESWDGFLADAAELGAEVSLTEGAS